MIFPTFPLTLNDLPQSIINRKSDSECCFIIQQQIQNNTQTQQQQYQNIHILLLIVKQYVILTTINHEILSAFKCNFNIKFKILKPPQQIQQDYHKPMPDQRQYIGIQFQFPTLNTQNQKIKQSFYLGQNRIQQQSPQLKNFAQVLEQKFITQKQKQFIERFGFTRKLAKGYTANVYSAYCKITNNKVAVKAFKKQTYFSQPKGKVNIYHNTQYIILTQVKNKYVLKLLGVYQTNTSVYMVTELLQHTLHTYINRYNFFQNPLYRDIMYKLLIGLRYLHKKGIIHRDLKPQNIMIKGDGRQNVYPVIVDLGLAQYQNCNNPIFVRCGTPGYFANQVINSAKQEHKLTYNKACDIFSLGVVFHLILLRKPVFEGNDADSVANKNKSFDFDEEFRNVKILDQIKNLLTRMLRKQASQRYTVQQLMDHQFFKQQKIKYLQQVNEMDKQILDGLI